MPVAEGVDHEDVDGGGHAEEIRPGGGEHVPRVHVEEAGDEVDAVGGDEGDEDDAAGGVDEGA